MIMFSPVDLVFWVGDSRAHDGCCIGCINPLGESRGGKVSNIAFLFKAGFVTVPTGRSDASVQSKYPREMSNSFSSPNHKVESLGRQEKNPTRKDLGAPRPSYVAWWPCPQQSAGALQWLAHRLTIPALWIGEAICTDPQHRADSSK